MVPYSGFAWGIRDVVVGVLRCDVSCSTCKGPTQYDCLSCPANQVLLNGDCVCDVDSGYFNDTQNGGVCTKNCTQNYYMNPVTRTCTADCSVVTYLFKFVNSTSLEHFCYENCPTGFWKMTANMSCVDDCYNAALPDDLNYYNFDGLDKVCYQNCPNGYYGDPESHYCVTFCPLTPNTSDNANISYYVQGKICVLYCNSTTYAYSPNRTCLTSCPTGFYKNLFALLNGSLTNICEDECSVTLSGTKPLGDNTTGSCVVRCPAGGYADYEVHLCLATCNNTSFKQEITVSGNIIRTC